MAAPDRAATDVAQDAGGGETAGGASDDDVRALIALAALGGPDRLDHRERLALGRALDASPTLRAELRALAAVAAALPPPEPRPVPAVALDAIPGALLRPEVVGAIAALVLLLGVFRVADASGAGAAETVPTATVASVDAETDVVERPWGVEVRIVLDGTEPGEGYDVVVTDHAGGTVAVGSFTGGDGTVRFVGTAGVPLDELGGLRVTDASGDVVLRADRD